MATIVVFSGPSKRKYPSFADILKRTRPARTIQWSVTYGNHILCEMKGGNDNASLRAIGDCFFGVFITANETTPVVQSKEKTQQSWARIGSRKTAIASILVALC